jgi:hypothetical protein
MLQGTMRFGLVSAPVPLGRPALSWLFPFNHSDLVAVGVADSLGCGRNRSRVCPTRPWLCDSKGVSGPLARTA